MSVGAILVVEDNPATRKMMRLALRAEGYEVLEADSGAAAIRLIKGQNVGLVLLDCRLPDIDGFELGRQLRDLVPDMPVIAVTGWAQSDESRVLAAGFLDVLIKPVAPSRLVEVVQRHIGRSTPRSALAGRTILLVDDDPTQRKLAQLVLTSAGFEVTAADSAEAALRLAPTLKPAAIVSDVLMPHMDGFAFCKMIRADPSLAEVPIVLMSAYYLEEEDRRLAARFGASRYVSRMEGLDSVVGAVLECIDLPPIKIAVLPEEDLQAAHLQRVAHQLERQANIGAGLARRVALQASALVVLDGLTDSLACELDPESALGETLARCLDAAGVSVGAILLKEGAEHLVLKAHVGSRAQLQWSVYSELLSSAVKEGSLTMPSPRAGAAGADLLTALGATSALVVSIVARGEALGVLLLASNGTDFSGAEGTAAVRAAHSVAIQLAQALALSRMFSRLAATEKRYRALFESARDGITITTTSGEVLEVNRRMAEILGVDREALIGRQISKLGPSELTGTGLSPPKSITRPNGDVVQVEFSHTVIELSGESCVLHVGRDVGERLRLEEQLRQSQKMEAVGRLAGGIAHDFNNILSVILTFGQLVRDDLKATDPMHADVEEICKAGTRAAGLTRQLLMFSRQQVLEPRVLDLNELVRDMEKMLQRVLGADVDLVFLPNQQLGRVRIDPGSIEQVILNLVVNSRDAMPTGGKLTIETANVTLDDQYALGHIGVRAGPHVMLAVSDTGIGIDTATQARMFEPFFTTKEKGKGTGLGLSTVFGIVQQGSGSVWVHSELGKGTTFKIYLPRVDGAIDAFISPEATASKRGTETILLVEDDDQVRGASMTVLRKSGYHVIEARNAGEALMRSEGYTGVVHLMLTDVVMPLMSGPDLAKRLAGARPDMRVLCMSGYTDDSIVRHGVLESNVAYLQKPFNPGSLTTRVREVLDAPSSKRTGVPRGEGLGPGAAQP
jgi:PAS domain S-box-containing protein